MLQPSLITPQKLVEAFAKRQGMSLQEMVLPETAIITPVFPLFRRLVKLLKGEPMKSWGWKSPPFSRFTSDKGRTWEGVIVCCAMGASNMAITLEELTAFGVQKVFFLGLAGGVAPRVSPGDMVLPAYAYAGEGTTMYYGGGPLTFPDRSLYTQVRKGLMSRGIGSIRSFPVYTTDALYRETGELMGKILGQGIGGIEMETSALFSVSHALSIRSAAILWVSDLFRREGWEPHFFDVGFRWVLAKHLNAFKSWLMETGF